jgi:hypothetical protein
VVVVVLVVVVLVGTVVLVVVEATVVEVLVDATVVLVVVDASVVDVLLVVTTVVDVVVVVTMVVDVVLVVATVELVVGGAVVVVVQSSGWQAWAQLVKAPHALLGGNSSSHLASFMTWQDTWPLPFTLRQRTKPGLPQSDAFRAFVTSTLQALGKPVLPSSCWMALMMGFQHCL